MEEVKDTRFELVDNTNTNVSSDDTQKVINDAEWCFQFFNNEPVVFAWSAESVDEPTPLIMQLQPVSNENLVFKQNGMEFKIFPRHITEETKKLRAEQDGSKN
jgi:hypothetical protein